MPKRTSVKPGTPASSTSGFTCRHYQPATDGKRCHLYRDGGRCRRPEAEQGRCIEWLKVNAPTSTNTASSPDPAVARDLFGNPIQREKPQRAAASTKTPPASTPSAPAPPSSVKPPLVRNVTDEEIASFKALGVEVCIRSDALGDVYLVPTYTGHQDRTEISIEHSITLTAICAAFPGAKVVDLKRPG